MHGNEFVRWLEEVTGQTRRDIASRLDVSPSLLTLIAKDMRPVTLRLADKVADILSLERAIVYEHAGLPFAPKSVITNDDQDELSFLRYEMARLKNPRNALMYSLSGRLDERVIHKLARMIELELEYAEEERQ